MKLKILFINTHKFTQLSSFSPITAAHAVPLEHTSLGGELTCNEIDGPRRSRLNTVLNEYLPLTCRRMVRVTPHDGTRFWSR